MPYCCTVVGVAGKPVDFYKLGDVHIPAAILKSFLRQLPEPILTYDLYDHIVHVQCKFTALMLKRPNKITFGNHLGWPCLIIVEILLTSLQYLLQKERLCV